MNKINMRLIHLSEIIATAMLWVLLVAYPADAQFFDHLANPTIRVQLQHPPDLGLKVDRVAFGPAGGECVNEVVDAMVSELVANGMEVVDRAHLEALLSEQKLALGGYVDASTAADLGRILGPTALLFVRVSRCEGESDRLYSYENRYRNKQVYKVTKYISRTRFFLKVSVQTVDLTSGRIFAAKVFDYSPSDQNESYDGYPEAPSRHQLMDVALRRVGFDTRRLFLPWPEERELTFYNDKKCNLKQAHELLRAGDLEGAAELSEENLTACKGNPKIKPKILAHAYYNAGMMKFIGGDYPGALDLFGQAARLRPGDIVTAAISDCKRALRLEEELQQVEETAAIEQQQANVREAAATDSTLTNDDIKAMAGAGLNDDIIIAKIGSSKKDFDVSAEGLIDLSNAGVSQEVISAMLGVGSR